ncbi:MAG: bifunctional 2-polyprenyl-6-hydroxyphenol methylase/3-demethylubiquinol 3-O-methyltransferase UbiG [Alphaproteobacteria bacterium]
MTASSDNQAPQGKNGNQGSLDPEDVARFEALADEWWDPDGPFRPLHLFNPVRIGFIRNQICGHFGRDPKMKLPLSGLKILDIGCGGGLVAEPMARLGATVTGIDPSPKNTGTAQTHGASMGLNITYKAQTAEQTASAEVRFDVVLMLEVLEHVADMDVFMDAATKLVAPKGLLIAATINRTSKAYAFAIVGAEYILGWVPRGTHDWNRFIKPEELTANLARRDFQIKTLSGLTYGPISRRWKTSSDVSVNFILSATSSSG